MTITKIPGGMIADSTITSADILDSTITNAKLAVDPANASNLNSGDVPAAQLDNAPSPNLSPALEDIALLAFKTQANGSLARYNLVDQSVDAFEDASGVDASASTGEFRDSAGKYYSSISEVLETFNESNSTVGTNYTGTIQSYTIPADTTEVTIETWGARGGSGYNSWKQATTTAALSGAGVSEYKGGFGARMKGKFTTSSLTGENIKILVGQPGLGHASSGGHGHGAGGGGTFVMVDHGAASTAGTTNGVANSTRYTPLVIAGGGGGANVYQGYTYSQGQTPWTRRGEADASATTSGSASSGTYAYVTAVNGAGGSVNNAAGDYTGGAGGGFLTDGGDTDTIHNDPSEGKGGDSFLNGGLGKASSSSYGTYNSGFGGGGTPNLSGGGGGGGYSGGGGGSGTWSSNGMNGGGGGSIINSDYGGSTITAHTGTVDKQTSARLEFGQATITSTIRGAAMSLVSVATTAEAAPTKGDLVFTYTNAAGTAVVGTNITAEFSADNGSTWTDFGIAAADTQGTTGGHTIVTKNNVSLTSTSGTSMRYRIKTLVQSAALETRIHAVSLGWS